MGQGPYTRAHVDWVQPATHNLTITSAVHETAIWVGLGGGSTVDTTIPVQVGTLMQTHPLGAPPTYSAVWQAPWVTGDQTIPNFTVKPGYQMTATISYSNGEYSLYLAAKNPTTGRTQVWSPAPFKASYTNDTAEAIVEAPTYTDVLGDHQYGLAPFKTVQFTDPELGGVYALTMVSNGHTLATTALPSLVVTFTSVAKRESAARPGDWG